VPYRHRHPQTEGWVGGDRHRPGRHPQKELIERAYRLGEALGLQVWCEDEAGPYQAIPHPGASWQPEGWPAHRPHEYVRGGTAKLLTLFRPATGEVRAQPVTETPNVVLHPWLMEQLTAIIEDLPPLPVHAAVAQATRSAWSTWQEGRSVRFTLLDDLPPLRVLLVLDNLSGHKTPELVCWLMAHGIMPLYTPLGGSWLNRAESVQRIILRRALSGQHPQTADQLMKWLADAVTGWNADPTPFVWGGKRAARRARARQRRHHLGGSGACARRPLRCPRRSTVCTCKGYTLAN
jgi:DDE superfamily endonuclease